ncbi:MAG TPA: hypothetical protein VMW64_10115, partial [Dehalococcoidia bacterium]|nr:hypothetical protein [Dehalococcoidia bacterium]
MESESWLGLDWQAVEAIGTCVGILILILAGCLACRQLSEAKRARNAQLAFPLFTELRSDEMKEHLRKIYDLPAPGVSAAVEKDVSYVLDRLEFLGILLALELV